MIVYHGTTKEFAEEIRRSGLRINKCTPGYFGKGFYTTPDFGLANSNYAWGNEGEVLSFVVSTNTRIIDLRNEKDSELWTKFIALIYGQIDRPDLPQLAVKFGIDALWDNSFQGYVFYNLRKLKVVKGK